MTIEKQQYMTTAEACDRLHTYPAALWSLVGRGLSPPFRAGPKTTYWLVSEIDALVRNKSAIEKALKEGAFDGRVA